LNSDLVLKKHFLLLSMLGNSCTAYICVETMIPFFQDCLNLKWKTFVS